MHDVSGALLPQLGRTDDVKLAIRFRLHVPSIVPELREERGLAEEVPCQDTRKVKRRRGGSKEYVLRTQFIARCYSMVQMFDFDFDFTFLRFVCFEFTYL
jgi:hypothetical protein